MKKKTLTAFLVMSLLTLSACGASGEQTKDNNAAGDTDNSSKEDEQSQNDTTSIEDEPGTADETVTDDSTVSVSTHPTRFTVTYEEKTDEMTADDGTVILTSTVKIPMLVSEETEDIALKINEDMSAYLASFSANSEALRFAKEDYADSTGEDGFTFNAYSDDINVKTTRLDDQVISFEITFYSYTGGAHGNYFSFGRSYNAQTGEQIIFSDLTDNADIFRSTALDYLVTLAQSPDFSSRLFPNIAQEDIESALFAENKWFFTNTGITFISDPYSLGPYASGTLYFTIPYSEAVNMGLKEDYHYKGNYTQERYYTYAYNEDGSMSEAAGDTEYTFDLNGDGTDETIAFYGYLYLDDGSAMSLYINGEQLGETVAGQLDPSNGYLDSTYVLYDLDPSDDFIEIGVLFSVTGSETESVPYTYFYRYTSDGQLIYLGKISGYASGPEADFDSFGK